MEKLGKTLLFDTDVVINVLAEEVDAHTGKPLWTTPLKLFEQIENNIIHGKLSVTSLLEIRYLMRRKKGYSEDKIEFYVNKILGLFEIVIPDEISILKSNELQSMELLDPFDAILLAIAVSIKPDFLVSRDKSFLKIASAYVASYSPEELIDIL